MATTTCYRLLCLALAACAAQGKVTVQNIVDDYVAARGGRKLLGSLQTARFEGNLSERSTGKTGSFSLITQAPNRFYLETVIEPEHVVEAYNGMSAWAVDTAEGPHTLTGTASRDAEGLGVYWNGALTDAKKNKAVLQFGGIEKVSARDAYHVTVRFATGAAYEVYFDTGTHLIVRETAGTLQFDYSDYRPVQGVMVPHHIQFRRPGREFEITVTRAAFNEPVADTVFAFPRSSGKPLPDIQQLLLEVTRNQIAIEEMQKQYTCHVNSEEMASGSKGRPGSTKITESEVFYIGGEEVRHLVAKDGKPLDGNEKRKEDEHFNKEFEKLTRQAADTRKRDRQEEKDEAALSSILRAIRFSNPRRERFRGQEVIAVDFGPNPDYKPHKMMESVAQKLAGVIWIDEQARDVARAEARFNNPAKIGGGILASVDKGTSFVFEQAKVNGEVWLPSYDEIHLTGRVLFLKAKANRAERYSECRKFGAESRIVTEQ